MDVERVLSAIGQAFQTGANILAYLASQAGYEIDTTNVLSIIASLIALYFTIISLYRTVTYTIRTVFWLLKWCLIFYVLAGSVGFLMTAKDGNPTFTWVPVLNTALAYGLKLFGWDYVPQVDVGGPGGVRVNGVQIELPADYHQYGTAWNKFKRSSNSNAKKSKSKSKQKGAQEVMDAAGIAQELLGGALVSNAWQSVESIRKGVIDSFKSAMGVGTTEPEPELTPEAKRWADIWSW